MTEENAEQSYESKDIKVLGDIKSIRTRPGMYIGDTSDPRHLLIEALDNALDEIQAGFSDKAIVTVDTKENLYSVRDFGRGIPIGKTKYIDEISGTEHEIETIQLVYTKNHAGGKFGGSSYKKSRGLHGIGLKAINALSEYVMARTIRDSKEVKLTLRGGEIDSLEYSDTDEPNGVYLEFRPDGEVFESPVIPKSFILDNCGVSYAFGNQIELFIDGVQQELPYKDVFDLLPTSDEEHEYFRTNFYVESDTTESIQIALKYTSETNTIYRGYTNMLYNSSGGTHIKFFERCYRDAWEKYIDPEFTIGDTFIGLRALVGVAISNEEMAFSSQTKERLTTNKNYFNQFHDDLVRVIQEFFDEHEDYRLGLIKRFKEYRAAQNKLIASKELSSMLIVNNETNNENKSVRRRSVVAKLRECTSKSREGTELYICEGDSAAGSIGLARDVRYQAILPIRGKILNVSYRSYIDCLKNEEVRGIVNCAGTDIGENCDASKSRYERYLFACDSDSDGYNIAALLSSIFVNLLPDLVKQGMVFVVISPLYSYLDKKKRMYTNNFEEASGKPGFLRYKGLGEMNPEDMKATCLSHENQELVRLEYPEDINLFNEAMTSSSLRFNMLKDLGLILDRGDWIAN